MSNNKELGENEIYPELLKYGTPPLDEITADAFSFSFKKHRNLDINIGVLIVIQKPEKKKGFLDNASHFSVQSHA